MPAIGAKIWKIRRLTVRAAAEPRQFAYLICAAHERRRSTFPSATGSRLSPPSMFIYVFGREFHNRPDDRSLSLTSRHRDVHFETNSGSFDRSYDTRGCLALWVVFFSVELIKNNFHSNFSFLHLERSTISTRTQFLGLSPNDCDQQQYRTISGGSGEHFSRAATSLKALAVAT